MGHRWILTNGERISVRIANLVYMLLALILFAFICLWQPSVVNGEERVELSVEVGFGNEIKENSWVPLRVTLTNNGGAPLEGNVFVQFDDTDGYGMWAGTAEEHVELPQGATKEITLILPSERLQGRQKVVFTADGKKVAEASISGNWTGSDTLSIGVLSTSAEAGKFLSGLASGNTSLSTLKPEAIPEVGKAISGLDVLVVNNFPTDTLSTNQSEAIKRWVASGGTLILGGGPEYNKAAQAFQELSPVEATGTNQIDTIDAFKQKKFGSELTFKSPITITESTLKSKAKALVTQDAIPIIATGSWQEGSVIYTAYNLTTSPLDDWQGNASLWDGILSGSRTGPVQYADIPWSLLQAVEYIPSLKLPSVGIIALAFLLYILIVGPILYLILRKLDKRGWAWGIIPLSAVLVALGVYAYGAGVRGNDVMTHHVNVLQMHANGSAELKGATGVFVPDGGTYSLQLPSAVVGWPLGSDFSTPSSNDWNKYRVRMTPDGTQMTFKDVEFWSMRKAYVEGQVEVGQIVADLTTESDHIIGTVKNESRLDLHDVYVLSGGKKKALGTLKAGETKQIDVEQGKGYTPFQGGGYTFGQLQPSGNGHEREEMLLQYLEHEAYAFQPLQSQVQLVGWSEQPVYESTINNKTSQPYSLSLVISPLHVKAGKDGKIVWPKGSLVPQVVGMEGMVDMSPPDGFAINSGGGTVTFRFDLNVEEKVKLEKLQADFQGTADTIAWLNRETGEWEEISDEASAASPDDFVSETGEVLLRISQDEGNDQFYPFPTLEAEGTVVK